MNPLRSDPTRTGLLVRKWERDLTRRIGKVLSEVLQLVEHEDEFLLKNRGIEPAFEGSLIVGNARWFGVPLPKKVELFKTWLWAKFTEHLLGHDLSTQQSSTPTVEPWWFTEYVVEAYKRGLGRAFTDTRKYPTLKEQMQFYAGTRAEFLRSAFSAPVSMRRVELIAGQVFTHLEGVAQDMSTGISRELVSGMIQGLSPRDVARNITKNVDGITQKRALAIARTETIRAHSEGQLDAFEALGVEEIGAAVEWSDANDRRVCPLCKALDGIVLKTKEAHGLLPRHVNCRCSWTPANVGEKSDDQKRTRARIEKSIVASLRAAKGKKGAKMSESQLKASSSWAGAKKSIDKERPESIF